VATDAIRRGLLVAIPTDTLFCIVADPFNLSAVARVFQAKCRAWDRSLSILVESVDQAVELSRHLSSRFFLLAHRYWPGPLSIIVEAGSAIPLKVAGKTGRLAIRKTDSLVAKQVLALVGTPLIGTSANVSGYPACESAEQVQATLGSDVALISDCAIPETTAATTVDLTPYCWRLIREGAIQEEEIREFFGE
jgi:L-threonylcarbamoyladenylate synthase